MARLRGEIERQLKENRQKALTPQQLLEALGHKQQDKAILLNELKKLQDAGTVVKTARGRYGLPERLGFATGVLDGNKQVFWMGTSVVLLFYAPTVRLKTSTSVTATLITLSTETGF